MKTEELTDIFKKIPLFSALDHDDVAYLAENAQIIKFSVGDHINTARIDGITVVINGSVAVIKNNLLMRILSDCSVSGVASLYGDDGSPVSELIANTQGKAIFIKGESIRKLISSNSCFSETYIKFLTSRIRFLNSRIRAYTFGSAEAKLAFHIIYSDEADTGEINLGVSMSALADMLNIGRASLYRACDSLVSSGAIERKGNFVRILNKESLLRSLHKSEKSDQRTKI